MSIEDDRQSTRNILDAGRLASPEANIDYSASPEANQDLQFCSLTFLRRQAADAPAAPSSSPLLRRALRCSVMRPAAPALGASHVVYSAPQRQLQEGPTITLGSRLSCSITAQL